MSTLKARQERQSPNVRARPEGLAIDTIVLHYTGMQSGAEAIDRLCDPAPPTNIPVSAHYVVEEDGTLWQLVSDGLRAGHAGVSHWRGRENLNDCSIGVEIVNPGHEWGYRPFPDAQIETVIALCKDLMERHPINQRNIVAHSDVAPNRKQDPGELFPWRKLAEAGIGLCPQSDDRPIPNTPEAIRDALICIGYGLSANGPENEELQTVIRAFQRHWRQETVDGIADDNTLERISGMLRQIAFT